MRINKDVRAHGSGELALRSATTATLHRKMAGLMLVGLVAALGSQPIRAQDQDDLIEVTSGVPQQMRSADFDYGASGQAFDFGLHEVPAHIARHLESEGTRFVLPRYDMPVPYQYNAGSCLYMTATGIMEWLLNQHYGRMPTAMKGGTDLSERYTMTLATYYSLRNNFTDIVDLFKARGGYVLSAHLPFAARMKDGEVDASMNWRAVSEQGLTLYGGIPNYRKRVIFSANGNQHANGVMTDSTITAIKQALEVYAGPVLFIYKPTTANWWHANMLIGYDDEKQVFYARDSAFGEDRTDLPKFDYGTVTEADDHFYSGIYELPYEQAKAWGNHATSYAAR